VKISRIIHANGYCVAYELTQSTQSQLCTVRKKHKIWSFSKTLPGRLKGNIPLVQAMGGYIPPHMKPWVLLV
jgi:hypothetical protein